MLRLQGTDAADGTVDLTCDTLADLTSVAIHSSYIQYQARCHN